MNEECVYLELPPYLAQWLIHGNGGNLPVVLPRLSTEHKILEAYLMIRPRNIAKVEPTDAMVPIRIPEFKYKPSKTYNYLPAEAMEEMVYSIRNRFVIALWNDIHRFSRVGSRIDNFITAWMKKHGIEENETNWNTIAKIYQRQRDSYRQRKHRAKRVKKR